MGVTLSRAALVTNTKAVSQACGYDRGKIIVSLVDPKREVRLYSRYLKRRGGRYRFIELESIGFHLRSVFIYNDQQQFLSIFTSVNVSKF